METIKDTTHKKMLYTLIAVTVIVILLGIYVARENAAQPKPDSNQPVAAASALATAGALVSPDPFFSFGNISMAAGNVSHRFTIENTGGSAITVTKLYTSCMCTTATLITLAGKKGPFGMPGHSPIPGITEVLAQEGRAQVEIVFDPKAHGPAGVGRIERVITVENSTGKPLQLGFVAMVSP